MPDEKFIDGFIRAAEKVSPAQNVYLFTFQPPARFVKSNIGRYIPLQGDTMGNFLATLSASDRVFIHWFDNPIMPHLRRMPKEVQLNLLFWGGDFFEQPEASLTYNYEPHTLRLMRRMYKYSLFHFSLNPLNYFHQIKLFLTLDKRWKQKRLEDVAVRKEFNARLNRFCHWNDKDYKRVQEYYGGNAEFVPFFYDFGFDSFSNQIFLNDDKNVTNIWIGNSSTFTNNHLDCFEDIKRFKKEQIHITAPLSYGHKRYGKTIIRYGKKIFGKDFTPLTDFIPIEQYLSILGKMDIVIMNHNRTQAGVNIFAFLRMGKKLFLRKRSTISALCNEHGIKFFYADDIPGMSFESFIKPLTIEEMEENRRIVNSLFSEENRFAYMKAMLA